MKTLYKFGQLQDVKITESEDGRRIVEGYFGDDNVDSVGHMIEREPYIDAMRDFINWGNIRDSHGAAIGKLVEWGNKAWNHIVVEIVDDRVWNLIKTGVYKGFSIGARAFKIETVDIKTVPLDKFQNMPKVVFDAMQQIGFILVIKALEIVEISVTDRPANRAALFTKNLGTNENGQINELPSIFDVSLFKEILRMEKDLNVADDAQVEQVDANQTETATVEQSVSETQTEVFDAKTAFETYKSETESRFTQLTEQINQFETVTKSLTDAVNAVTEAITKLTEKTEDSNIETVQSDTEQVTQSEQVPVVEQKSFNIDELVKKVAESVVPQVVEQVKTVVANLNIERQNTVNRGEGEKEEIDAETISKMTPHERTKFVAKQMAAQFKK